MFKKINCQIVKILLLSLPNINEKERNYLGTLLETGFFRQVMELKIQRKKIHARLYMIRKGFILNILLCNQTPFIYPIKMRVCKVRLKFHCNV
jgi:hypothetical protein